MKDDIVIVSAVRTPVGRAYKGTLRACDASLKRLKTERLDLYLLHWRQSVPLRETLEAFVEFRGRKPDIRPLLRQSGIAA